MAKKGSSPLSNCFDSHFSCLCIVKIKMSQSLAKQCNEMKERYDTCFLKWYSEKYLRGSGTEDNNECSALFKEYSKCLQGALKERGIDKLLEDAREDNKENDTLYLGRKK
ncbi:hypothetical protein B0T17DRAFT_267997 [Bombardia bombarda]|uniref:Uncharacterized protein n=1 Tax=Bombardia bombarda TaxID=252184 RepID=A0AA39X1J2_9PEZI|nr:hypothetical protein B0T17DRAFT_267997 [Bombardia bombarda]